MGPIFLDSAKGSAMILFIIATSTAFSWIFAYSGISGDEIKIEERDPAEVTEKWYARRMAPEGIHVYNPAFDVTPAELITAIITEKGIAYPPFRDIFRGWKECK